MNYQRLTIDLYKAAFYQYVATGSFDCTNVEKAILNAKIEIDRLKVNGQPTEELEKIITDLEFLKYDIENGKS